MTNIKTRKLSNITLGEDVVAEYRKAESEVHPLFLSRWSPRSYSGEKVAEKDLVTILEAASWAPSASNEQPWRFIIARTNEERTIFNQFIHPRNQLWSNKAPVLILLASKNKKANNEPNHFHDFDAGAAWANLALQATILGLSTRAIGGFDKEKAKEILNIPEDIDLQVVIALGYKGDLESLQDDFQKLEKPNTRRSVKENIFQVNK
ncbi:nitroreductase family protein [Bacillus sp. DNRA2]|uniref:nitroreductase family protein n=1 Tax=Bacillus sp. DNRA2 TaxID=2723053 RepID=UPI00145EB72F|nr:nitroreductase family protein [Bacillus sp. DNRA2]NMD70936.1 nitroreductase family protein [Bacillus sp. DNRA2]